MAAWLLLCTVISDQKFYKQSVLSAFLFDTDTAANGLIELLLVHALWFVIWRH